MSRFKSRLLLSLPFILFITLIFQSCEEPYAGFSIEDLDNPERFESIQFFNESIDAIEYYWNFGDGDYSSEKNPEHSYDAAGTYKVALTASDDKISNTFTKSITINEATVLNIKVYTSENSSVIKDCEILIYDNEYDWTEDNRAQIYGYSGHNGESYFLNMEGQVYYIRAYKYTDYGKWEGLAVSDSLTLNQINIVPVYCDFTSFE